VGDAYPRVVLNSRSKLGSAFSKVSILSLWSFAFQNTPFIVDIAVRRSWASVQDMSHGIAPESSLNIAVYGETWTSTRLDDGGQERCSGRWGSELEHLFYDEPGERLHRAEDRVRRFLQTLDTIRASLEVA
jgi:hypothetical protein